MRKLSDGLLHEALARKRIRTKENISLCGRGNASAVYTDAFNIQTFLKGEKTMQEKKYKLRFYKLSGHDKGNLDHEEYFCTREEMEKRYAQVFKYDLWALNPTGWEKCDNGSYKRVIS